MQAKLAHAILFVAEMDKAVASHRGAFRLKPKFTMADAGVIPCGGRSHLTPASLDENGAQLAPVNDCKGVGVSLSGVRT